MIHLISFQKAQYTRNKPLNKIHGKDLHWNVIQYEFDLEDDLTNPTTG